MRMLIDSFLPQGITQIAVDSIFMMPQLGVLSTFHEKAAIEVFHKDCLVKLGTCLAPIGQYSKGKDLLTYSFNIDNKIHEGTLKFGEIILIKASLGIHSCKIIPERNVDLGFGKGQIFEGDINGGEVGIVLDGRGREIKFLNDDSSRINQILEWSKNTLEYNEST